MIKTIIFDLNGVFIRSPKLSDRFRDKFNVLEEKFLPVLKEIMAKVRLPNAGDTFSYWKPYLEKWGVNLSKEDFFNFWFSAEREVPEMIEIARGLKNEGFKIFILSNNFAERTAYYDKNFSFLKELFGKVYYSWQTGFTKSAPEAYKIVLSENGLKPEECIYFDDSKENVELATSLGIKAFIFEEPEGVVSILRKHI
ncbi:MAG: HAD-IA family hydrolase [bacterium]|nr:HAD-IA family hydrolase [bacterium]